LSNVVVNGQPVGSTTDLKYPDSNSLPIFNGKVPKPQSLGKIAQQHCSKSCPV